MQELNPYLETEYITDRESVLETRSGTAGLEATLKDGGSFGASVSERFERLHDPFRLRAGGVVPAGDHSYREGQVRYQSSQGRPLSGNVALGGGGYFHGERRSVTVGTTWRPTYRLGFELRADHNDLRLPEGDYTVDVYGARVRYAHSTSLSGSAYVQYNQALEQLVTNVRLNLVHAPLSDLFLVYTERRAIEGYGVQERLLTAKITRMVAF